MSLWLHHWIWIDLWSPIWPNLAASAFCAAIVDVRHVRRTKQLKKDLTGGNK